MSSYPELCIGEKVSICIGMCAHMCVTHEVYSEHASRGMKNRWHEMNSDEFICENCQIP